MAPLAECLDIYARDMLSEARMNQIGAEFRQLTDRQDPLGAVELLYLRRLLIEGKAVAQAQRRSAAFGVRDLRQVRQAHVSMFRDMLMPLPKSWGKGRNDAAMTWASVMAHAKTLPPAQVGLAVSTINRHLDVLAQILSRAEDDCIPQDPKVNPKKLRLREMKRSRNKRAGFSEPDLKRLFRHPIWTGCKSVRFRSTPGTRIIKNGLYWVQLIAADTGARRIPVHDRLIALGVMEHVAAMQRHRAHDLLPELRPNGHFKGSGKRFGDAVYTPFAKALEHVLGGEAVSYLRHAFRHYVNNRLSCETSIPKAVWIELIGHEGDDWKERVYIEPSPIVEQTAAVDALPVIDDLPPGEEGLARPIHFPFIRASFL